MYQGTCIITEFQLFHKELDIRGHIKILNGQELVLLTNFRSMSLDAWRYGSRVNSILNQFDGSVWIGLQIQMYHDTSTK